MARPLFPWPGGKRRLAKVLIPLIENAPHRCYCEPFAGGAAMLFARQAPAKAEVLNDTNRDIVSLYRVVTHHLDEFVRQFRWALNSREMFRWAQLRNVETLTDVQRAARFYYLQHLAFAGKATSQTFGTSTTGAHGINLLRLEENLSAAHLRLAGVAIECLPWQECVARYDRAHTLFFCDPPYWQTEGYGVGFDLSQYEQLAEVMAKAQGRFVLTINDHPRMRRIFGGFDCQSVAINYQMAGGGKAKAAKELIFTTRMGGA